LADVRLPVSHWAARLTILFVLAATVFMAAFTGTAVEVGRGAYDCASRVTLILWAPLLEPDDPGNPAPPRPINGCSHRDG
jgi:hypothetical protein